MDILKRIREKMAQYEVDGFLVTDVLNIRYISGFTGSSATLLITDSNAFFLSDFRYEQQANDEVDDFEIIIYKQSIYLQDTVNQLICNQSIKNLGFEADTLPYDKFIALNESASVEFIPTTAFFSEFRARKSEDELLKIKKAAEITDKAYKEILKFIKPGKSELEVANELDYILKALGSDFVSRSMTVASGARSALPHGRPSDKIIGENEVVILDFGAIFKGYHSDMTRTVMLGTPDKKLYEIYNIVHEALIYSQNNIKAGMDGQEVDFLVRKYINEKGYGEYFGHGSGHGIGLAIHEDPFFSPVSNHQLLENMVITIEPGIYLPNIGGVRIENNLVIKNKEHEIITKSIIENI